MWTLICWLKLKTNRFIVFEWDFIIGFYFVFMTLMMLMDIKLPFIKKTVI